MNTTAVGDATDLSYTEELTGYYNKRGLYVVTKKDFKRYLEVMTDSFLEYPLMEFITGGLNRKDIELFLKTSIKSMDDNCITIADSEELNGVLCFFRPGTKPGSLSFVFNGGLGFLSSYGLHRTFRAVSYMKRMAVIMEKYRKQNDIYIYFLATDPKLRGKGIGHTLMQSVTDYCSENGFGAYLETNDDKNVRFYRNCGFTLMETSDVESNNNMKLYSFYKNAD